MPRAAMLQRIQLFFVVFDALGKPKTGSYAVNGVPLGLRTLIQEGVNTLDLSP